MIVSIKNTWADFWEFIKNPKDEADSNQSTKLKLTRLFSVLGIELLIMLVLTTIISVLEHAGIIDMSNHKVEDMMQSFPAWAVLVLGALIIPFLEEVVFRFYLRFKNNYPLRFLIFLSSIFGQKNRNDFRAFSERKWHAYYKLIFYFSAFLFAIVHLSNFDLSLKVLIFLPLLVMPQFIVGLFTGYLRVKFGLVWSFFLHGLHNFILFSIALFFMHQTTEELSISNGQYDLRIEEQSFRDFNSSISLGSDTVSFTSIKLKPILSLLLDVDEYNIAFKHFKKESDKYLNLYFKRHDKSLIAEDVILNEVQKMYGFSIKNNFHFRKSNELLIADSTLLFKHKGDDKETNSNSILKNSIKIENARLDKLVSILNKEFDKRIVSRIKTDTRFNFEFQTKNFDDIESKLKQDYGLYFEVVEREFKEVSIDFSEHHK